MSLEDRIREKIQREFKPQELILHNESAQHASGVGAETHFKVFCVSDRFEHQSLIERHRQLHALLKEELQDGVHALSLILKTPEEASRSRELPESPPCRGGGGED
ncbi:MAG: BolA family transcriptional regulator [Bradymonadales bacterium]|nr:MAG: BolA family transcriptional regulator [Bradymonadales bacterium]